MRNVWSVLLLLSFYFQTVPMHAQQVAMGHNRIPKGSAPLTPAILQHTAVTANTTVTTTVPTFASATTTGSAVEVCGGTLSMAGGSPGLPTATGATFASVQQVDNSFDVSFDCFVAQNITGGQTAYTFNHCSGCSYEAFAIEMAPIALTGSPLDGTPASVRTFNNTANPTGSTTPTSGKNIVLISVLQSGSAFTVSPLGGSWTSVLGTSLNYAYQVVTSPSGSYSATWTAPNTFTNYIGAIHALKTP